MQLKMFNCMCIIHKFMIYIQEEKIRIAYATRRVPVQEGENEHWWTGLPRGVVEEIQLQRLKLLQFNVDNFLERVVSRRMRAEGINYGSYLLPISLFMFIYFAGFLVTMPLINSVLTGIAYQKYIPVFDEKKWTIPLTVVLWGFLGGFVYTSISLLNRFLRNDLTPTVYFYSSFRLLMSAVVGVIIYFLYIIVHPNSSGVSEMGIAITVFPVHAAGVVICEPVPNLTALDSILLISHLLFIINHLWSVVPYATSF
jgi:hypothetical protein